MYRSALVLLAALTTYPLHAGETLQRKSYTATRIEAEEAPVIDGVLDDTCWKDGDWGAGFLQRKPYEGEAPSQVTRFRIAYDERNLYVAIRADDSEPDLIEKRITRRDTQEGDRVTIYLDSYFDRRTAFAFTISSAGVKSDVLISEDGDNEDPNWDAVWHAEVASDHEGWAAEMAIPFSQLRFGDTEQKTWGIQVRRFLHRKEEVSGWQLIPNDAPGFVNWFGDLHGLDAVQPRRQIELIPYAVAKTERFEPEAGNPFATGSASEVTMGLDGRMGVTSDLTLTFTVNPDFGQVEADPSEVNLTTSETFFEERRPFFIEGRNILDFQVTGGDGGFSRDNLFYSRRIGRPPQYEPEFLDDEYGTSPFNTSIIGAFKLTGKTRNGVSIGILDSVTDREYAEIDFHGERRRETIEPLTNYFLGRVQKDFDRGNTILGGIFTATNRSLGENDPLAWHNAAYTGGVDFTHQWKDRTYYFSAKSIFSNVRGDPEVVLETQESPVRYFQRPDAEYVSVDPTRTSLSGHGGTVQAGKGGSGHFKFSAGATWRSPGLELNDVGFLRQADEIMHRLPSLEAFLYIPGPPFGSEPMERMGLRVDETPSTAETCTAMLSSRTTGGSAPGSPARARRYPRTHSAAGPRYASRAVGETGSTFAPTSGRSCSSTSAAGTSGATKAPEEQRTSSLEVRIVQATRCPFQSNPSCSVINRSFSTSIRKTLVRSSAISSVASTRRPSALRFA